MTEYEGWEPQDRLQHASEYRRCYRQGRRRRGKLLTLHYVSNDAARPRFGITASRRVGGAVMRNRLKRRVREILRRSESRRYLGTRDIVVHLKPSAAAAEFAALRQELEKLLNRLAEKAPSLRA